MAKGNTEQSRSLREQRLAARAPLPEPPQLPDDLPQTRVLPREDTVRGPRFIDSGIEVPAPAVPEGTAELAVPEPEKPLEGTVWTREVAREHVMGAYGLVVELIIKTGSALADAKLFLPHGQYTPFVAEDLPFGMDMAQRYTKIAAVFPQVLESKTARARFLPASVTTLAILASAPPEQLMTAVDDGRITPEMTRADAEKLAGVLKADAIQALAAGQAGDHAGDTVEKKDDDQADDHVEKNVEQNVEDHVEDHVEKKDEDQDSAGGQDDAKPQASAMDGTGEKSSEQDELCPECEIPFEPYVSRTPCCPECGFMPDATPEQRAALKTTITELENANTKLEKQVTRLTADLAEREQFLGKAMDTVEELKKQLEEFDQAGKCQYGHELTCPRCTRTGYDDDR